MALTLEPRAKRNNKNICRVQAICGSGQNGRETSGEHRGQANDVHGTNGGTDTGASYYKVISKPMVVVSQGHNNTGELRCKPTAVTANKSVDIAGELIVMSKKQAKRQSRHEGIDIAASYYHVFEASQQQWSWPTRA